MRTTGDAVVGQSARSAFKSCSQMRRDDLQQQRMDVRVACAEVSGLEKGVRAVQVADHAARLGDQQAACGDVPRLEAGFKEAVVATRCDPRQVQCGRAGAAQAGGLLHQVVEDGHVGIHVLELGIGEAGADQAVGEVQCVW